jgi:Starch-binding associating with outer membrane
MKQILYKIVCLMTVFSILLSSCTKDFQEINTDPNDIPDALPQQLLAPALVSTLNYNMVRNRNFNNELMQVSVDMSDADGKVFRYDYRPSFSDYLYNGLYTELTNFKDIYKIAADTTSSNYSKSYMGISLVCQSWIYSILTDTYGDIPYFQSNLGKDSLLFEPAFDRQKDIYLDIFKKLEEANILLTEGAGINGASDPVYGGNISKWRKFANSLYLRLLLRVSGKAEVSDMATAKIREIVEGRPADYPIMTSNTESAILRWTGTAPYINPLMTIREQDYRLPAVASFFIDNLVRWADPRINTTMGTNGINRWGIAPYQGAFEGVPSGYAPAENPLKKSWFYSNTSAISMQKDTLAGMILNYAEVNFILAEAAAKGWISSPAETYYNKGVENSITQWLPNWTTPVAQYLIDADMQWVESVPLEEKMEKIHLQKYYALFMTDLQQWFEYRRTGHPVLPKGAGLRNGGVMPARMVYPVYVQSTNPTNYKIAVANQGPDVLSTQVWWQKP